MFVSRGHRIKKIFATGGIPKKNPLLMQILSDVLQIDIAVCLSDQTAALGSAILGAAAAKNSSVADFAEIMSSPIYKTYRPNRDNAEIYNKLYNMYSLVAERYGQDSGLLDMLAELK